MAEADVHFEILHAAERMHREGEILQTFREDLAEWMSDVLAMPGITSENFFESIENGGVLCRLAQSLHNSEVEWCTQRTTSEKAASMKLLKKPACNLKAAPGSFFARDNLAGFLRWCSGLGVPDVQLFEPNDLVERKSDKNVLNSLMEIARHCHVQVPKLVQMEREIEQEMRSPSPPPTPPVVPTDEPDDDPLPNPPKKVAKQKPKSMPKDELSVKVENLSNLYGIRLIRVKKGQYKIANSSRTNKALFVRLLRSHVVVRVGGGWDTLEHYLSTHERVGVELSQVARRSSSGSVSEVLRLNAHDELHDPDAKADALGMTEKIGKNRIKVLAPEVQPDARLAKLSSVGYTSRSPTKSDPNTLGYREGSPSRPRRDVAVKGNAKPIVPPLSEISEAVGDEADFDDTCSSTHDACVDDEQRKRAAYMPSPTRRHRTASPSSPTARHGPRRPATPTGRGSGTPTGRRDSGRSGGVLPMGSSSPKKRRGNGSPVTSPVSPRRHSTGPPRRSDSATGPCRLLKCQGRRGCVCTPAPPPSSSPGRRAGGVAAVSASRARSLSDAELHRRVSPRTQRKNPGPIIDTALAPLEGTASASSSPLRSISTDPTTTRKDPIISAPAAESGDGLGVRDTLRSAEPPAPTSLETDPEGVCIWYQLEDMTTGQAVGDVDCVIVDGGRTVRDLKLAVKHARPSIDQVHVADMLVHLGDQLVNGRHVLCESEDIYTVKALLGARASMTQMGQPVSTTQRNSPAKLSAPRMYAPEDMSEEHLLKVLSQIDLHTNV
eukprot:m.148136 g.148136  ORF g.148136 m.148136 type:complete len:777 (-) comp17792_c0_seq7:213-2543(-)